MVSHGVSDAAMAAIRASGDPMASARNVALSWAEGALVSEPRITRPSRTKAKKNTTQKGIASGSLKISAMCKQALRHLLLASRAGLEPQRNKLTGDRRRSDRPAAR